ncbi:MAG: hypothetical protein AB1656_27040 [Candidatus Omnitrophota bacterium]
MKRFLMIFELFFLFAYVFFAIDSFSSESRDWFDFPILIGDTDGVYSVIASVVYDEAILEYAAYDLGEAAAFWMAAVNQGVSGKVTIAMAGAAPLLKSGSLMILHFKIKNNAELMDSVRMESALLNDGRIGATIADGRIEVDSRFISFPGSILAGPSIPVPIMIDDASGVNSFRAAVGFDENRMRFAGWEKGFIPSDWTASILQETEKILIELSGKTFLDKIGGPLIVLRFEPLERILAGEAAGIRIESAALNEGRILAKISAEPSRFETVTAVGDWANY